MSGVGVNAQSAPEAADLSELATAAKCALKTDAVLITTATADRPRCDLGAEGVAPDEVHQISKALEDIVRNEGDAKFVRVPSLADPVVPGGRRLTRLGYRSGVWVDLRHDGARVGTLCALWKDEGGSLGDEDIASAFAAHSAIAVECRRLRRRAGRMARRLESLEAFDCLALTARNFNELIAGLNSALEPFTGTVSSGIQIWDQERDVLQMVPGSFGADDFVATSYQIALPDIRSNAGRVFTIGSPYLTNRATGDPAVLQDYVEDFNIERLLSVPLGYSNRRVGVLHLANRRARFTVEDVQRTEALVSRIATTVELARTLFRLRSQQGLEKILSEVAVAIASSESILSVLPGAFRDVSTMIDGSLIALVPTESPPIMDRRLRDPAGLEGEVLAYAATQPDVHCKVVTPKRAADLGWAVLHVPVRLGADRIGTLSTLRMRGEPFAAYEVRALTRLANLTAMAWTTERYQQQRAEVTRLQERNRIADDLHDEVAQILFGAQLSLDAALETGALDARVADQITHARALLIRGDTVIRDAIRDLSPPPDQTLVDGLVAVVEMMDQDFSLTVRLEISELARTAAQRMPSSVREALLKTARESLINAAKHAGPCRARITLRCTGTRLLLMIVDDGIGPHEPAEGRGHGIGSLQRRISEHGGMLQVRPGPTGGTQVTADVPL